MLRVTQQGGGRCRAGVHACRLPRSLLVSTAPPVLLPKEWGPHPARVETADLSFPASCTLPLPRPCSLPQPLPGLRTWPCTWASSRWLCASSCCCSSSSWFIAARRRGWTRTWPTRPSSLQASSQSASSPAKQVGCSSPQHSCLGPPRQGRPDRAIPIAIP